MYNFNIDKILLQRAIRNTRSYSPINNFYKQQNLIENLQLEIEKNIDIPKLIQLGRRQLIISLVSALEVYFKDQLVIAFDSGKFNNSNLANKINKTFYLADIQAIIDNNISVGEIIAGLFTFSGLSSINKVYSLLIDEHFLKLLNKFEFEIAINDKTSTNKSFEKTTIINEDKHIYKHLNDLYSLRPYLTHDQPEKSVISEFQIQKFLSSSSLFVLAFDCFIKDIINKRS